MQRRQSVVISYTHTLPNMWLVQHVGPGVHYGCVFVLLSQTAVWTSP